MDVNVIPKIDMTDNPTGCCPRFHPEGWDNQTVIFDNMKFVHARTMSLMHMPLNMGRVFGRVQNQITTQKAELPDGYLILSNDNSSFSADHFFAVSHDVTGEDNVTLSGTFMTAVFEGPFRDAGKWHQTMLDKAKDAGKEPGKVYFFYTTCPNCAKVYGKNYVVGFVEV